MAVSCDVILASSKIRLLTDKRKIGDMWLAKTIFVRSAHLSNNQWRLRAAFLA